MSRQNNRERDEQRLAQDAEAEVEQLKKDKEASCALSYDLQQSRSRAGCVRDAMDRRIA